MFFFLTHIPWVDLTLLEHQNFGRPSIVLDDQGNEWTRFQIDKRKPVSLSAVPRHVINAFLTSEDRDFFSHGGISLRGIVRSLFVDLIKGRKVQGASTITQQLVRLLFFDHKKTFQRKIKEQLVAIAVERQFTKELILETYLNNLYFGCGIYGIEAASERFWDKHVSALTIAEGATLAAIIPRPERYCPLVDQTCAQARRNIILRSMYGLGHISQQDYQTAVSSPVFVKKRSVSLQAPYVREQVRIFLEDMVGKKELYSGGLTIQTTLNQVAQRHAQEIFRKHITSLKRGLGATVDGSLISLDVETGGIRALVGGYDFAESQFNRALSSHRQIGSTFKPIVYTAAVENGLDFDSIDVDETLVIPDHDQLWMPQNYNQKYEGPLTLGYALITSKNTVAVKTLLRVGIANVAQYAQKLHLAGSIPQHPSLALGCLEVSPLDLAATFNVFAHKGVYVTPYLVVWVKDFHGKKIWKYEQHKENVLQWRTVSKVSYVMRGIVDRLKHQTGGELITPAFGKTGTTNENRTCWFAGATPSLTTVVYVGRDNNQPLGEHIYPSSTAFPIWLEFNQAVARGPQEFAIDPSLKPILVDAYTGAPIDLAEGARETVSILK